jgi:cytoskeletal protein CcmA (bactofilin family)
MGADLRVKGEISGNEDLVVEGEIDGLIRLGEGRLTVGETGKVTVDVSAREVIVYGLIKGNLVAVDRIEIKSKGLIMGDLRTARIVIEDGARLKGSIEVSTPDRT